jgi:hypothetical protein
MIFTKKFPKVKDNVFIFDIDSKCKSCKAVNNITDISDLKPVYTENSSLEYDFEYTCPFCEKKTTLTSWKRYKTIVYIEDRMGIPLKEWATIYDYSHNTDLFMHFSNVRKLYELLKKYGLQPLECTDPEIKAILNNMLNDNPTDNHLMNQFISAFRRGRIKFDKAYIEEDYYPFNTVKTVYSLGELKNVRNNRKSATARDAIVFEIGDRELMVIANLYTGEIYDVTICTKG